MIVIYAEKADVGNKLAAALGGFELPDGTRITYRNLKAKEKEVKKLQSKQGYLDTIFKGNPCKVTWGYGHMYGLQDVFEYNHAYKSWKARPPAFIPEEFKLHPIGSSQEGFQKRLDMQRQIIKKLFSNAEYIINATDYDREGELIFAYIYEAIGCKKPYYRAHFTSQTEEGIQEAFDNLLPASKVESVEMAGRARSIYDWLIGTNLTTQYSLKNPGNGVLSVGRVQTPLLKMLVERELAIKNFKSTPFWTIQALFKTAKGESYKATHKTKRFEKKADAEAVMRDINGKNGAVTEIKAERSTKKAPLLYSLSALQMDANDAFGYTAEKTLEIAQWLYENGYTTYPRTKSQYLNDDMSPVVIRVLSALEKLPEYNGFLAGKKKVPAGRYFCSAKVDSHFAIIPTIEMPSGLTEEHRNIYDLIVKSLIRTIYPDAVIENTTVTTAVGVHSFLSTGTTIIEAGWLDVGVKKKETFLPALSKGQVVSGTYECKQGQTEAPKRYTDKTLIAAMKTAGRELSDEELKKILADPKVEGIGTEATRAEIINTLINREYAKRSGKQFYATERGIHFIESFPIKMLMSPAFTAEMERELTKIADGTGDYNIFLEKIKCQTVEWCSMISSAAAAPIVSASAPPAQTGTAERLKCPSCGGLVAEYNWGWGCTNYRSGCEFRINKIICKKKITNAAVKRLVEKGETNLIKGFTSKSGKSFDAKLKLDEGKVVFSFSK